MKLIDLLVLELPRRGGWPEGKGVVTYSDISGNVYAHGNLLFTTQKGLDFPGDFIDKDEYEAALAASQQPAWSGEGLPPVGIVCDFQSDLDDDFNYNFGEVTCTVLAHHKFGEDILAVLAIDDANGYVSTTGASYKKCRPTRTEAERKRDTFISAIGNEDVIGTYITKDDAELIYDAIAAGKIPGVKLE